ncbi:MAG: sigma-54-dependent Fis family transcriptional regulator [Candidatus Eisenbacteria bacterium]|nr:sigma-54-dependent Fis family transcriptional regulator [Candidatus Eisenbacteria bacterium]
MASILLVDDDADFTTATAGLLDRLGHRVTTANDLSGAREILTSESFDILLLDLMLPDGNGFDLLTEMPAGKEIPHVAIITGNTAVTSLVKSVMGPNVSYLIKPISMTDLQSVLEKVTEPVASQDSPDAHFGILVGESPVMHGVYKMIERVAATGANVLLQGESGVGKELVAQSIHRASSAKGRFVAANCGAISRELIGSELFGHEKGAFTGAVGRRQGVFEQAVGGTLFLDEITEMPIDLQPNLLRVLETNRVTRLGATEEIPVDCRVISATNRTAQQLAAEQCLREDLYFRLAVFPISIPPLREREGDVRLLANSFLAQLNDQNGTEVALDDAGMVRLESYSWPGNVRELRHAIHRAYIMSDPDDGALRLPDRLASPFAKEPEPTGGLVPGKTISEVERELIQLTLEKTDGDKPEAAQMLGISLKTLYNRLNAYKEEDEA